MAAGHRPCAYCRRSSYNAFSDAWGGRLKTPQMDAVLHAARVVHGARALQTQHADATKLPARTFIKTTKISILTKDAALPYTALGYGGPKSRPISSVTALTAPPMINVMLGGYAPKLHHSAG